MKYYLHLSIEIIAVLIATAYALFAAYGIFTSIQVMNSLPDYSIEKDLSRPYITNTILLCIGALLGALGIYWGFISKVRKKNVKNLILLKALLIAGIITVITVAVQSINFSTDMMMVLTLAVPVYVGFYYIKIH